MAAGLVALGQEHVGSGVHRQSRRCNRLNLADGRGSGAFRAVNPRLRVGEREDQDRHPLVQRSNKIGWVGRHQVGDEPDAERPISLVPDRTDLFGEPPRAKVVAAAECAQTAGERDCRRQTPTAVVAHRRVHNRVVQTQQIRETSV